MKTKLLLLILSWIFLVFFPYRAHMQSGNELNHGLTAMHSSSQDVLQVSWWGSASWTYQVHITDDLDSLQWTVLPELFPGEDAVIELNFAVTGASGNRMFYRVIKLPPLFSEDPNMLIRMVRFIGKPEQRGAFENGIQHGIEIGKGWVFTTGRAVEWDSQSRPGWHMGAPGDQDLEEWMVDEEFSEYGEFQTWDASGIEIAFEPTFSGTGTLQISFLFASNEYYNPYYYEQSIRNDGMAIFMFELDQNGNKVPSSRKNIGLLPTTETHSKAINVFNLGELFDPQQCRNLQYFRKNSIFSEHYGYELGCSGHASLPSECDGSQSLSPCRVGYSGYSPMFVAQGEIDGDKRYLIKAVVADFRDRSHDSAMFIKYESIESIPNE